MLHYFYENYYSPWDFPSNFDANTRMVNATDQKQNMQYRIGDYVTWGEMFSYYGLNIESPKSWHQVKRGRARHMLSYDGATVSIQIGPDFYEDFTRTFRQITYGKVKVVVKGTPI